MRGRPHTLLMLFRAIRRAPISTYFLLRITIACHFQAYQQALKLLIKWERKAEERETVLPLRYTAFKGELFIRTGNQDGVKELFDDVLDQLKGCDDGDSGFMRHYSKYWLALIRTDFGQARYHAIQGNKICDSVSPLELPIYKDEEVFEPDDFLVEAAEKAGLSVEDFFKKQIIK